MMQELNANRNDIERMEEYNLNTLPNKVDLLVVKKLADTLMKSGLGRIFRKWNLIEYKSPEQSLGMDTYYRSMGYAYLFAAFTTEVRSMDERSGKGCKAEGGVCMG